MADEIEDDENIIAGLPAYIRTMREMIGDAPKWNPMASDQEAEFNRWKHWSSRRTFLDTMIQRARGDS